MLSVSGEYGIINQIEFQGRSFAGESVAEYHVVETNDIVYTKSPLKANPYGIIKVNNGAPGIVSTLYAVYHPCEGTVAEYIDYYFGNDLRLNKYLKPLVNISAIFFCSSKGGMSNTIAFIVSAVTPLIDVPCVFMASSFILNAI